MKRPSLRLQGQRAGLKLDFTKYKPKYRERNVYTGGGGARARPARVSTPAVSEEKLLENHVEHLGYSQSFLGLHFMISYAVQALVQLAIVGWSVYEYASGNSTNVSAPLLAAVLTVDIIITVFLVVDLMAHVADSSSTYWDDWGNRLDAVVVAVVLMSLALFFNDKWRAEYTDASAFTVRFINDLIRVLRILLFARRIRRAIRWDNESMGYAASRGHCLTMEDVCVVVPDLGDLSSFFAVYDGHAGNQAAEYCAKHLHREFSRNKLFETDAPAAMREAFTELGAKLQKLPFSINSTVSTAATCVHIREREMVVAWVGSSRAVLGQEKADGECVAVELTASVADGGSGTALARLGDAGDVPAPNACTRSLSLQDKFVIIASDGVWSVIDPQQAVELVSEFIAVFGNSKAASEELVDEALRNNADDNVSVVVVWFQEDCASSDEVQSSAQKAAAAGAHGRGEDRQAWKASPTKPLRASKKT